MVLTSAAANVEQWELGLSYPREVRICVSEVRDVPKDSLTLWRTCC